MHNFKSFSEVLKNIKPNSDVSNRPVVCVQGLGFVGTAMAIAVASAIDKKGSSLFNVIGVEIPTPDGLAKVEAINKGEVHFKCNDNKMVKALSKVNNSGNLIATTESSVYSLASIVLVNVGIGLCYENGKLTFSLENFSNAIKTIGSFVKKESLIIIETTVPPGTSTKLVVPMLKESLEQRGLPGNSVYIAHSYERVMPGKEYLDSIVNFWRVYAGYTVDAADRCEEFLSKVINVKEYPLTRLSSITASETAKVLENSYRAVNIAFMEEWGRFAESVGIDIFEIVDTIRKRPTHANIRQPGFGVGGYCLTKDPLFASLAAEELFKLNNLEFPFCEKAVSVNSSMPLASVNLLNKLLENDLKEKRVLLLGISYRQDVGDTRFSPSEYFFKELVAKGASMTCHDPIIHYWPEMDMNIEVELSPLLKKMDAIVFAVPHKEYIELDILKMLEGATPAILDANNVLSYAKKETLKKYGCKVASIGVGEND